MQRSRALSRGVAALGSGVLIAAAQPGFGLWPLALVCFVPLLWAWRGTSLRARIALGWLAGTAATTLSTASAGVAGATAYFGLSGVAPVLVVFVVGQIFGALSFVGLAAFGGDPLDRRGLLSWLRFGAIYAGMELLRGVWFTGFPWLLLAYSLLPVPELAGWAAYFGVAGVSLLLACANAALAAAAFSPGERNRAWGVAVALGVLLAGPGMFAGSKTAGRVRVASGPAAPEGAHRVLLVQPGAVPQSGERGPAARAGAMVRQTQEAAEFEVAVWPENAMAALLPENLHLVLPALDRKPSALLILGAPRTEASDGALRTSALLIDANGLVVAHHDKRHLLPFAEYAPGPLPMRWFGTIEARPGESPGILPVGETGFGPLICYEVLFSGLARDQVNVGAAVLLNLSNDAWFGDTGAAEQHLAAAMFRALETGRPILRATHTGITAAIDSRGRVVAQLPMDQPGTLLVDVFPGTRSTLAVRWGEAPVWLAFGLAMALPTVRRIRAFGAAE